MCSRLSHLLDLQRWDGEVKTKSPELPKGRLVNFEADGQRLKIFLSKRVFEWNLHTGWSGVRKFEAKEKKRINSLFEPAPGEPQFRSLKNWCCAIVDGNIKSTSPKSLFQEQKAKWDDLSAAQRSMLLSEKARKSTATHTVFGVKAAVGLSAVAALIFGIAMALTKFHII